jgi:soluble lytic murein transglycosylase-like protein
MHDLLRWAAAAAALATALWSAPAGAQAAGAVPSLDFSALIQAARISGPMDFCGEPVPFEDPDVRERMEREILTVLADPHQVILWIKRSRQYLTPIEEALRKHHLPDDLKYVAIAESALRPHAGSSKGAMGFWQFIESTGRNHGLRVDSERDERRSLSDSTEAAIAYLRNLREMFGSWTLAVAAYNMGENGLRGDINQQNTRDYYRLYLPLETQRYVFRILTAKLILKNPERYGFRLEPEDIYPPAAAERVTLETARELPLLTVAQAAGTDVKYIKDLNPEIRGFRLSPGRHRLLVPKASVGRFHQRLSELANQLPEKSGEVVYVVKEGDTLSEIAERHKVSVSDVRAWNRLDPKKPIQPGMRLTILNQEVPSGNANP